MAADDRLLLAINGQAFYGWKSVSMTRGLLRCNSSFELDVSQRWTGQDKPWAITEWDACTLLVGNDLLLTGYVQSVDPGIGAARHEVRITGHSKTIDLVECGMDIASGQFSGYTVAAICRAVYATFGGEVVVQTDAADQVVANTNIERCETAWQYLERLCRLAGVLACDDAQGRLLLTRIANERSTDRLVEGVNLLSGKAKFTSAKRFSVYIEKGQAGLVGTSNWGGAGGVGGATAAPAGAVQTQMRAVSVDAGVPRYRPHVAIAESQLNAQQMQARANWRRNYAFGRSRQLEAEIAGWRQSDGTLWQVNQLVPVTAPTLSLDQELVMASVTFSLNDQGGRITKATLGPVEGYTPDPGEVKLRKHKHGHGGGGINWSSAGGIG